MGVNPSAISSPVPGSQHSVHSSTYPHKHPPFRVKSESEKIQKQSGESNVHKFEGAPSPTTLGTAQRTAGHLHRPRSSSDPIQKPPLPVQSGREIDSSHLTRSHFSVSIQQHQYEQQNEDAQQYSNLSGSFPTETPSLELIGTTDQISQYDSHPPHSAHTETIPLEQTISTESRQPETGSSLPAPLDIESDIIFPLKVVPIPGPAQISEEPTELTSPEKSPIQNEANSGDTYLIEKRT